jgi:hypothetical protein
LVRHRVRLRTSSISPFPLAPSILPMSPLDVAGQTLPLRAGQFSHHTDRATRVEHVVNLLKFLGVDRTIASHRHGRLRLTLPFKGSVKPRGMPEGIVEDHNQLIAS